jgi:hypothetical protein
MKFITDLRLLILAIWLGAAVFFIGVAQVAFSVLQSGESAGAVVNGTLSIINYSGLGIAVVLFLSSFLSSNSRNIVMLWAERVFLLVLAAACAAGQFVIGLMLMSVRAQMTGPVENLAADDPLRLRFDQLHEYSVWVLMAAMAAALIAFFLISNRRAASAKKEAVKIDDPYDFSKEFKV